jgi:Methyltransferase domain.
VYHSSSDYYDIVYQFKNYEQESMKIHEYIQSRKPETRTILDVACGTGKHMSFLNRYYQVDGIDLNERFIDSAKRRNPASQCWVADMTDFNLNKKYDVIMCLFSSIGFVKTLDKVKQTTQQFVNHLSDNGFIIIEPWFTPEQWIPGYISVIQQEADGYKVVRMSHADIDGTISILHEEYLIGSKDGILHFKERHELGLFAHEDLKRIFQELGLIVEYDSKGISGRGTFFLSKKRAIV